MALCVSRAVLDKVLCLLSQLRMCVEDKHFVGGYNHRNKEGFRTYTWMPQSSDPAALQATSTRRFIHIVTIKSIRGSTENCKFLQPSSAPVIFLQFFDVLRVTLFTGAERNPVRTPWRVKMKTVFQRRHTLNNLMSRVFLSQLLCSTSKSPSSVQWHITPALFSVLSVQV